MSGRGREKCPFKTRLSTASQRGDQDEPHRVISPADPQESDHHQGHQAEYGRTAEGCEVADGVFEPGRADRVGGIGGIAEATNELVVDAKRGPTSDQVGDDDEAQGPRDHGEPCHEQDQIETA